MILKIFFVVALCDMAHLCVKSQICPRRAEMKSHVNQCVELGMDSAGTVA